VVTLICSLLEVLSWAKEVYFVASHLNSAAMNCKWPLCYCL